MRHPDEFNPTPEVAEELSPGIRRILCDNPSPFTFRGTNTYLVGQRAGIAVIDPGPVDERHMAAILGALGPDQHVSHILTTHAHGDHTPLARPLAEATGAPVLAYGPATRGQSEVMRRLAAQGGLGGGEGMDTDFRPDRALADGEEVGGDGWRLTALWTPGHHCNHLSFDSDLGTGYGTIFTGDHVMAWSTSIVSPPDGDLTQFMESCRKLRARPANRYLPGHGPAIDTPHARLDWLVEHRMSREAAILDALGQGPADAQQLAERVYTDISPNLLPAAARNVLAHLIDLTGKSRVTPEGELTATSTFRLL
ncbi:MBL fold metallo-hydrolase [Pseudooceanicola sp.]|uniref:MBL fold metallo-hydrolase n=1 Tax=Pseudooceanicola sp. TaxID=1914328 RepID=UPI0035C6AE39